MTSTAVSSSSSHLFKLPKKLPPSPFDTVGFITFTRTYARKLDDDEKGSNEVESWEQMIQRIITACNTQLKCNFSRKEQLELFYIMYNLKGLPAGRFLWSLGTKTIDRLGLQSLQNCAACVIDDPIKPFCFAMDFMMCGVGVGYNLTPEYVDKLPPVKSATIKREDVKDADFIVPDSREGWVKLLGKVLKAHFYTGKSFTYSLQLIREIGTPIKTFGGTASGGNILEKGMTLISELLNKRKDQKLRPVDALDIMNIIGMIVIAGNTRRCRKGDLLVFTNKGLVRLDNMKIGDMVKTSVGYSKVTDVINQGEQKLVTVYTQMGPLQCTPNHRLAVLTSPNDFEWVEAQNLGEEDHLVFNKEIIEGGLTVLPEYKNLDSSKVSDIIIPELTNDMAWFFGYFHGNGHVYNKKDGGEIGISTPSKYPQMANKVIEQVMKFNIYPKQHQRGECTTVMGYNKNLRAYFQQFKTSWTPMIVPDFILKGLPSVRGAYLAGLFDSDGTFSNNRLSVVISSVYPTFLTQVQSVYASLGIPVRLRMSKKAKKLEHKDLYDLNVVGKYSKDLWKELVGIYSLKYIPSNYKKHVRYNEDYHLPRRWFNNVNQSQNSRYKIKSDLLSIDEYKERFGEYPKFVPVRVLSVDLEGKNEHTYDLSVENNHEYFCGEGLLNHNSAEIALGDVNDSEYFNAKRWDLGNIPNWRSNSNNSIVCDDINALPDFFWDCYKGNGEPIGLINMGLSRKCGRLGDNQYPDKGVIGYNPCAEQSLNNYEVCCLSDIFLPNIEDKEELFKVWTYLYRICKNSLALHCNNRDTEDIVHKNMRIGVGITGYLSATEEQQSWLSETYLRCREYDVEYSKERGYPTSIKLTTVKPSGSLGLLAGVTPGGHPGYAHYYIRRIRFASNSPLLKHIRDHGYHTEYQVNFDGSEDKNVVIAEFPCKLPDCAVVSKDMSAIQQLEVVKRLQTEWSDNAVSVTVYYRKEELDGIKDWLKQNYNNCVKTVSFLLHSEHGFKQAPYEEITKEKYEELKAKTKVLVSLKIGNTTDDDAYIADNECQSGQCPLR